MSDTADFFRGRIDQMRMTAMMTADVDDVDRAEGAMRGV